MQDSSPESKVKAAASAAMSTDVVRTSSSLNPEFLILIERLKRNDSALTTLDLMGKKIGDPEAIVLAEALTTNRTLIELYLGWNQIGDAGAIAFARALTTNRVLTKLRLSRNKIDSPGAIALAKALTTNRTLTELHLGRNQIGGPGAIAFARALTTNRVLTKLKLPGNKIDDPGAIALAEALTTNCTLTKLGLLGNEIGDSGAIALAEALTTNFTLIELYLGSNQIGDPGAIALAEALTMNCTLTKLYLDWNQIGDPGAIALVDALITNHTLSCLILSREGINAETNAAIGVILSRNQSLEFLQRQDYSTALFYLEFVLASNPNSMIALLGKGNALLGMGRSFPEISTVFKAVLALAPTPSEQALLQKVVQHNPAYLFVEVALPYLVAQHLFEQQFYPEALKALEAAQLVAPEATKSALLTPFYTTLLTSARSAPIAPEAAKAKDQGEEKREGKEEKLSNETVPSASLPLPAVVGAASSASSSSPPAVSRDISPELVESMMVYLNQLTLEDLGRYVGAGLNLDALDRYGKTFFLRMVQANQLRLVEILLKNPKLKIAVQSTTPSGDNALHLAVAGKNIGQEMVVLLLERIAIDCTNHAGQTPLYQAVDSEQLEKILLLLERGAKPLYRSKASENAVECAIRKDQVALLEPLLHIRSMIDKEQLLLLAARAGALQILDYLHREGAYFKIVDGTKRTVLHIVAVQANDLPPEETPAMVEKLIPVLNKLIALVPELLLAKDNEGKKAEESTTDATLKALLVNARQKYQRVLDETEQSLEDMERCSRSIVQKVEKRIGRPYQESDSLSNAILSRLTQDLSLAQRLQVFQNIVLQTAFEVQIIQALVEPNVSAHRKKPDIWVGAALDHGKMQGLFLAALNSSSKKEEKTGPTTTATVAAPAPVGGSSAASTTLTVITSASLSSAPQERNAAGEGKSAPSLPTAASALTGMPQAPVSRAALFSTTVSSNSGSSTLSVASPATPSTSSSNSSSSPAVAEGKNSAKERFIQSFAKYFEQCYAFSAVCAHHDVEAKLTPQQETARKALQGGLSFAVDTHSAASVQEFLTAVWKNWKTPNYRRVAYLFADPWNPSERTPIIHEAAKKLAIKYAEPLEKLRDAGIDRLARCAVMRAMDYISSTTDALYVSKKGWGSRAIGWVNTFFNPHVAEPNRLLANPVDVIITGVWKGKSKGVWHKESIARTSLTLAGEMLLETLSDSSSSPWTAEGVITRSGIIVNGCKYIDKRENNTLEHYNEALKYGFCEGSMDEVRERGYQEKRENKASCVVR